MDGWLSTWYIHVCTVKSLCFNKRHQPKNFFILLLRMIIIISILIVVMALSLCKKGTEGCSCIYNGKGTVAEEELWRYKYQSAHFPFFLSSHWKQKALFEMNKTNIPSPYPSHVTIHALTVSTFHYWKIFLRKYFPIKRFSITFIALLASFHVSRNTVIVCHFHILTLSGGFSSHKLFI